MNILVHGKPLENFYAHPIDRVFSPHIGLGLYLPPAFFIHEIFCFLAEWVADALMTRKEQGLP